MLSLVDCVSDFARFSKPKPDTVFVVADYDQGIEAKPASALYRSGRAFDEDDPDFRFWSHTTIAIAVAPESW